MPRKWFERFSFSHSLLFFRFSFFFGQNSFSFR